MSLIDGRGRWIRGGRQRTVDSMLRLNAHQAIAQRGLAQRWRSLWRWEWRNWQGPKTASIAVEADPGRGLLLDYQVDGQPYTHLVRVATTTPHFGGLRYWFLCPQCGRQVADLYGGPRFLCRQCHRLTYRTAQAGRADIEPSVKNRLRVLRQRLGVEGEDRLAGYPGRPTGMHRDTYERLVREYTALADLADQLVTAKILALTGLRQRTVQTEARQAWRQARRTGRFYGGLYDAMLTWLGETDNPIIVEGRERRAQEAEQDLARRWRRFRDDGRLTLGDLAKQAGVPYAFAVEAQAEGLLRPDGGRDTRTKRFRPRLASWLGKLQRLRADGHTWADLRAWVHRRWQPGHEDERQAPRPCRGVHPIVPWGVDTPT